MFVPLTTVTLAQLSPAELPQGTGLYNFFRQLGGSFGIAGIATLLSRYTAQTRSVLADRVVDTDPMALARLKSLTGGMIARGADPWTAKERAFALLDRQLVSQASIISYSKIYVLSALLILVLIPLLALVRETKGAGGGHAIME
jgi:DHA2 family multidrug resistance protein